MDAQRQLLDELMGTDRNLPPEQRVGRRRHFSDPEVCKYYLCGLSPHYLFKNTKSADEVFRHLGNYQKICDDQCKEEWEALPQEEKNKYGYEYELKVLLEKLVSDGDRRIARAHDRVSKENAPIPLTELEKQQIDGWSEEIKKVTEESEAAAEEGDVDAAEAAMTRIEIIKKMKQDLERSKYPDKMLSVCPVSGVYLSSADNEQRKNDHVTGKQYMGWKAIRDRLEEMNANPPHPPRNYDRGNNGYDDSRRRDNGGGYRGGERRYSDHRDRERGSRGDYYHSRDRDSDRSRDRDGYRRDRDQDYRRRRSRSPRDRDRDRGRDRDYYRR